LGEVQLVRVESLPTNLHWNVEPVSLEVNSKVAVVPITLPLVMVVWGGVVSAASARSSVIATNANRASNGTNRIRRFLNRAPPCSIGFPSMPYFLQSRQGRAMCFGI
jgi:hypothetical protein